MSFFDSFNCETALATLREQLEHFQAETMQKLNDLISKEEVNQLWKLGMESSMHNIWDKVYSQHFSVSVSCQTDEQGYITSQQSSSFLSETCPSSPEDSNCLVLNDDKDHNRSSRGEQLCIVVIPAGYSFTSENESPASVVADAHSQQRSNPAKLPAYKTGPSTPEDVIRFELSCAEEEDTRSTPVVSNAPQQLRAHESWSEEKISYPCIDCDDKFPQNETSSNSDRDCTSPNPSNAMSCLIFNDEEDQQNEQAANVVIPPGSSSANENESTTPVVLEMPQDEPSNLAATSRSEHRGSLLSTHGKTKSSQDDASSQYYQKQTRFIKPSITCQRCSRVFSAPSIFARHDAACQKRMRKLPFECVICKRTYATAERLRMHSYYHKQKKSLCPLCGKAFRSQTDVNTHMVTHTGEHPYHCRFCAKRYTTRSYLMQHIRTQHQQK